MSVTDDRVFTHDDAQSLLTKQTDIKNSIDALTTAVSNINNTAVYDGNGNVITETYAPINSPAFTGTPTAPTPNPGDNSNKIANTEYVREEIRQHANMPIGFEYFTFNPSIPQGSLPLFGAEYDRDTYSDLWDWVQTQTGYLKTEAEWQTLSASNNGNVPYYSSGDGSTTFRVPSLKCWVKGANGTVSEVGSYLEAGLPNITGSVYSLPAGGANENVGALSQQSVVVGAIAGGGVGSWSRINLNATNSNPIYGNSTTVQPESIVGLWLVKAYGVIVDTGQIDEQQYIDDRIAALPTSLATTFLPLIGGTMTGIIRQNFVSGSVILNSASNNNGGIAIGGGYTEDSGGQIVLVGEGNANNPGCVIIRPRNRNGYKELITSTDGTMTWDGKEVERVNTRGGTTSQSGFYVRYDSGIQICWGGTSSSTSGTQITFPVPFNETPRIVTTSSALSQTGGFASDTSTGFKLMSASGTPWVNWIAIGYWK